jgi:hypothetical protein
MSHAQGQQQWFIDTWDVSPPMVAMSWTNEFVEDIVDPETAQNAFA